jgi:pimeloyl-ACP methyl ester carboxylesterase
MLGSPFIIVATSLLAQLSSPALDCTPDEFQGWFRTAAQRQLVIPRSVAQRARHYRYVFVGGFASERMPGYLRQSAQELRRHGVPPAAIHFIYPSSHRSLDDNSDDVRNQFGEVAALGTERLVVIAHSRGANDTLAFALKHPSFSRDRVQALFLVQGAFGGSGVADFVLGEGIEMDRQLPPHLRLFAHVLVRIEEALMRRGLHEGLYGLTRSESRGFWERMRQDHAAAIPIVGPKVFYITSQVRPTRLRLFRRALAAYLQTYYGPNDGLVALDGQTLPWLGTNLGTFAVSHTDLTHRFPATRAPRRLRRALIDSILVAVGRSESVREGLTVSDAGMAAVRIKRAKFQGDRNYTISPRK